LIREAVTRGTTVVLASHEHERASAVAGRVVTMGGGRVLGAPAAGSPPGAVPPSGDPAASWPVEPAHVA